VVPGHDVTGDANDEGDGFEGSVIEDVEGRKTPQGATVNIDLLNGSTAKRSHLRPQTAHACAKGVGGTWVNQSFLGLRKLT
jgi:hypothetical protein